MKHATGVFSSRLRAESALEKLAAWGIRRDRMNLLSPEGAEPEIASTVVVPSVGPVIAQGRQGAALLGAANGDVPFHELHLYEHALREGRSIIVVFGEDAQAVERHLQQAGAESIEAERLRWWQSLRLSGGPHFREGFEAALHPGVRGRNYEEALPELEQRYAVAAETGFRDGFERGQEYYRDLIGIKTERAS